MSEYSPSLRLLSSHHSEMICAEAFVTEEIRLTKHSLSVGKKRLPYFSLFFVYFQL
jgi:hypothetical protein